MMFVCKEKDTKLTPSREKSNFLSAIFRIIFINCFIFFLVQSVLSQEIEDTSAIWRIETKDGNEFFGTILSKDSAVIHLKTKMLGVLSIPESYVLSCMQVYREFIKKGEVWMRNLQAARYFYSPNGFGLEKASGYYQNTWVLFNQASYGVSNYFSLGVGMMPLFLLGGAPTPVWFTPKLSMPVIKEKFSVGGGVLLGAIVGGTDAGTFGITYAVATVGNHDQNVTAGFGYAFSDAGWSNSVVNLCGMMRVGKKSYLLTENYFFSMKDPISGRETTVAIIFIGGRTVWPKLSLDYGLVSPVNLAENFVAIPWLGFTLPLGGK